MTSTNQLTVFRREGVDIRVVMIDGDPWWVAADVAAVLGLGNPRSSLALLDDDERAVHTMDTLGGPQSVAVVSESGLYSLILRSRKEEAKAFKRWITHDVLPSIRKTGAYNAPAERALPHSYADALRELLGEVEAHEETRAALAEVAPRAAAWDELASAEGDYSVADAAKILARGGIPIGPQRLFNQMALLRWTYRGSDHAWRAYADRVSGGFLAERPQFHYHPSTGEKVIDAPQVRVTLKGLEQLRRRLTATTGELVNA